MLTSVIISVKHCQVYYLSKATIKAANKKFSSLNNQYEIILDANSEVTEVSMPFFELGSLLIPYPVSEPAGLSQDVLFVYANFRYF